MKRPLILGTMVAIALVSCTHKTNDIYEQKAEQLMSKMTLQEKIGQLTQLIPTDGNITGPDGGRLDTDQLIRAGRCGSILSEMNQEALFRYQKIAVDSTRLGIPLLFGYDYIHGAKTTFPENLGLSCSWNTELVEKTAAVSAKEAAAFGYAWTFSPMCDVMIDPRWGRVSEGSGEDAYLSGQMSAAMVRGYQGDDLSSPETILACVKHFAAYGAAEAGRDYNTVDMSEMMFRDRHLPSYKAALDAGALSVMSSFNDLMGVPASGNKWLLSDLLRDELGFKGFVVSDYNAVSEMCNHGVAADWKDAAALALNAGLNMDMVDGAYTMYAEELVKEGRVSKKQIDRLCKEILIVKYKLGLFDDPYRYGSKEKWEKECYLPESLELAREAARASMVLLKNECNVLPLHGNEKIALIGPAGNSKSHTTGAWSGMAESRKAVSFLEGLKGRFDNVTFEMGSTDFAPIEGGIARAVKLAKNSDIVLLALGLPSRNGGEAASMTSIDIPEAQRELFDAVVSTGKPVVLLLSTGRPMTIAEETEASSAVLVTWHAGIQAGNALADILSGDYNPSGRLTCTFPLVLGQVPIHYNSKATGRPMHDPTDNNRYLSRYLDAPNVPLFSFGEGLSYTSFEYSGIEADKEAKLGDNIKVSVKVTNTGGRDGIETVQLYLHDLVASTTRPVRELKGFEQIALKAGETKTVEFIITPENRSFCRADMSWGEEDGDFDVFVGHDSKAELKASFSIR